MACFSRAFAVGSALLGLLLCTAPARAQVDLVVVLEAEADVKQQVYSLAFSPDGRTVAVGGRDVNLFNVYAEKPELLATLKHNLNSGIPEVQFSPNGKFLATAGSDHAVRVWSVIDAEPKEVSSEFVHTASVRSLAFSADGKQLASGGDDSSTILWDVGNDGKLTQRFTLKKDSKFDAPVRSLAFNARLNRLITVNTHGDIRFFSGMPAKLTQANALKVRASGEPVVAVSPDGKSVAVSEGRDIITYAGKTLKGHKDSVTGLSYSPSGQSLASCSRDGRVLVWNSQTGRVRFILDRELRFTSVAYPPPPPEGKVAAEALLVAADDKGKVLFMKLGPKDKK